MTPIETRHCLYHVFPWKFNDVWKQNVDVLALWCDNAFNGRRIAAIATDGHCEPYDQVAALMESLGFECHHFKNDPQLREAITFGPLLKMVETTDPATAVFYGHTKGNTTRDGKIGSKIWRNVAYRELVREWERCVKLLEDYAAVGIHRIAWPEGGRIPYPTKLNHGSWMFAGTFFWFRADAVYTVPGWDFVPEDRYGAEAWLSGVLPPGETKSVYQLWPEYQYPSPSPYWPMTYPEFDQKWEPLLSPDARAS
jgi:hypothetical protein